MTRFRCPRRIALSLAALLLAGCAATGARQDVPAEVRAQERWDALLAGDFVKAWGYLSPGARSRGSAEAYAAQMKARPVRWKSAEVLGVECPEPELCKVTVKVGFTAPANMPRVGKLAASSAVIEKWIRLDGQWYYVPREIGLSR
ncbi:MAG: hypothetical protein KatS3mg126_0305 [Lysobacteraceae bacterium]|nr:MAG: hypothetical protein KatS3mg126_0305 [Xanthomonadaceae bacterium]